MATRSARHWQITIFCDNQLLSLFYHSIIKFVFELFWKNSSYVSVESVCIFVALYLRMFFAGANKVEGTMSWCLGTNEILASVKHGIAKVKQGHFETAILILHNFFVFYYGYRCLKALHQISSWFKRCVRWYSCLRSSSDPDLFMSRTWFELKPTQII